MIENVRKGIESASAIFAILFVGAITMNFILNFMLESLSMMIMDPFKFIRYFIITAFVFYGLYHAYNWFFNLRQHVK